jgi:hypothetical protein
MVPRGPETIDHFRRRPSERFDLGLQRGEDSPIDRRSLPLLETSATSKIARVARKRGRLPRRIRRVARKNVSLASESRRTSAA